MKNKLTLLTLICLSFGACHSMKKEAKAATTMDQVKTLEGAWTLDLMPSPKESLDQLFPNKKPSLAFQTAVKKCSGYTGCNSFYGPMLADSNAISFKGDLTMTLRACQGDGEAMFMLNLKKVNRFSVSKDGETLTLIQGDIALMRFHKKEKQ